MKAIPSHHMVFECSKRVKVLWTHHHHLPQTSIHNLLQKTFSPEEHFYHATTQTFHSTLVENLISFKKHGNEIDNSQLCCFHLPCFSNPYNTARNHSIYISEVLDNSLRSCIHTHGSLTLKGKIKSWTSGSLQCLYPPPLFFQLVSKQNTRVPTSAHTSCFAYSVCSERCTNLQSQVSINISLSWGRFFLN